MEQEGEVINIIIGDIALKNISNGNNIMNESTKIKAHLQYVENLLRMSPSFPEEGNERIHNIELLHRYWNEGIFPKGEHHHINMKRRPNFRDSQGNLCAVGYLIQHGSYGGQELVDRITYKHAFDYVKNMCLPELLAWQENSGLTVDELAMIQPTYEFEHDASAHEYVEHTCEFEYIERAEKLLQTLTTLASAVPNSGAEIALVAEATSQVSSLTAATYGAPELSEMVRQNLEPKIAQWKQTYYRKNASADELFTQLEKQVALWIKYGEEYPE